MKHNISRFAGLAMVSVLGIGSALAVPARPVPIEIEQPDGTKVTLTLRGDEYFHYYETSDGYIVKDMTDGWYRIVDNVGEPTDMPALNVGDRDAGYRARLSNVSGKVAFDNLRKKVEIASPRTQYRNERLSPSRTRAQKASFNPQWDNSDGHFLRAFPAEGDQKVLVILVSFADKGWTFSSDPHAEMQNMLQQPGYSNFDCTGSAYDYFVESSRSIFRPSFDVYGPVKLPRNVSYYGGNNYYGKDQHPEQMVIDACSILDAEIDFSQYDRDGDGVVDNIYVFYAGYGEADGGASNTVWPHSWDIRYAGAGNVEHDGVLIGHYACSNELNGRGQMTGIGTFCHEFSHVLGLPDLYATSYSSAHTPGEYSLMDHGSYNNNSRTPPVYSSYERYALEWGKPFEISKDEDIRMRGLSDGGNFYKMTIDKSRPTEYFLFENRQPVGNDVTTPAHGMLVWHIDYKADKWTDNVVNDDPNDQCIDIVEADGSASDADMDGDTFPGLEGVTEFSASSVPAFKNKNGAKSQLGITNIIEEADGIISFRVGEGMNEESDYICTTPYTNVESIGSDSFTLTFKDNGGAFRGKGNGGEVLLLSVESTSYDEEDDRFTTKPLENYTLRRVASGNAFTVEGVSPLTNYTVKTYRETTGNLSEPYSVSVLSGGETVAETKTNLNVSDINGNDAVLAWTAVDGADHYLLTVATREQKASTESLTVDFSGTPKMPEGWTSVGVYSSQAGNYGQAAPSFYLSYGDDYLRTADYAEKDIESVQFWCRKSADKPVGLSFYSVTSTGSLTPVATVDNITTAGKTVSVDNLPEGVHGLVVTVRNADGTRIFIDDIKINFAGDYTDTPVGQYDDFAVDATRTKVTGLDVKTAYVAYVKAHDGEKAGVKSNTAEFTTTGQSGIEGVEDDSAIRGLYVAEGTLYSTDPEVSFDVIALDGTAVALGAKGSCRLPSRGVYIVRLQGKVVKIIY